MGIGEVRDIHRRDKMSDKDIKLLLLKSVDNNFDLGMVTNILEENKIPFILKDPGIGSYMRIISGQSFSGTNIYVEESSFEKAVEILENFNIY